MYTYIITFTFHSLLFGGMKTTMRIQAADSESAQKAAADLVNEFSKAVSIPVSYRVRKSRK